MDKWIESNESMYGSLGHFHDPYHLVQGKRRYHFSGCQCSISTYPPITELPCLCLIQIRLAQPTCCPYTLLVPITDIIIKVYVACLYIAFFSLYIIKIINLAPQLIKQHCRVIVVYLLFFCQVPFVGTYYLSL